MMDSFEAERYAEEKAQRDLFAQQGVSFVVENPDIAVNHKAEKAEVYHVAEAELLKLKMRMVQKKEIQGADRDQLANLINLLISQGGSP